MFLLENEITELHRRQEGLRCTDGICVVGELLIAQQIERDLDEGSDSSVLYLSLRPTVSEKQDTDDQTQRG